MVMYTMVNVLIIATIYPSFQSILPHEVENIIAAAHANVQRFSFSVKQSEWHIVELGRLDQARRLPAFGRTRM